MRPVFLKKGELHLPAAIPTSFLRVPSLPLFSRSAPADFVHPGGAVDRRLYHDQRRPLREFPDPPMPRRVYISLCTVFDSCPSPSFFMRTTFASRDRVPPSPLNSRIELSFFLYISQFVLGG